MQTRTHLLAIAVAAPLVAGFGCARPPVAYQPVRAFVADSSPPSKRNVLEPTSVEGVLDPRKPGDFVVFQISGSFRKGPALLSQRVIDRHGAILVMDYTLIEGTTSETLRVSIDVVAGRDGEVFDVSRIENGVAMPAHEGAWEELLGRTVLSADENLATMTEEDVPCTIFAKAVQCKRSTYRVRIEKKLAFLTVTRNEAFPWGAVTGRISTDEGNVLFESTVVQMGESDPNKPIYVGEDG